MEAGSFTLLKIELHLSKCSCCEYLWPLWVSSLFTFNLEILSVSNDDHDDDDFIF